MVFKSAKVGWYEHMQLVNGRTTGTLSVIDYCITH